MPGIQPPSSSRARSARPPSSMSAAAASPGTQQQRTTILTSNNSTINNATANNTPRSSGAASPVPLESVVIDYNDKSTAIKSPRNTSNSSSSNVVKSTNVQVCVRIRPLLSSDFRHNINDTNNINNIGDATPRKSSKGFARETTASSSHRKTPATTTKKSGLATPTASGLRRPTSITQKSTPPSNTNSAVEQLQQQSNQTIPSWQTHTQDSKRITQSQHTITSTTHHNPERLADYTFDRVYNENETTNVLYEESIKGVVESFVGGYHGSVFAYGQTNSGKTHTMTGSKSESGVVRLAVQDIFNRITSQSSSTNNREYLVRVSYLEIYNEQIYDLLALPQPSSSPSKFKTSLQHHHLPPSTSVRIFESRTEGVVVRGLREEIVTCPQDVYDLLDCGDAKRKVGSTGMNKTSSRSHSVFRLVLESRESKSKSNSSGGPPNLIPSSGSSINSDTDSVATGRSSITQSLGTAVKGPVRISSLSLVDLAGSESVKATNNTGVRQKEGQYINKSLLTLGHVVHKLSEISKNANKEGGIMAPKEHIPYRDSKLTRLLQPSLGGNAQVCIICNISPALSNLEESHNTLKFAMRAKKIQQHARITEVADEKTLLRSYREEIEELKRQLKEAKQSAVESAVEQQQIHHRTPRSSSSGGGLLTDDRSSSSDEDDQDDTHVLVSAIANLESLILKAGANSTIRKSINDGGSTVGSTVEGDESLPSRALDATLMKAESNESREVSSPLATQGQQAEDAHDDQVIQELHRIQGMLGSVMSKKKRGKMAGGKLVNSRSPERDAEVERLRLELQSQEAASTMRKADSSFLQSQLNEKEEILKEVSVLLEALEKRQLEMESENKLLKEDLKGAANMIEEGDNVRLSLERQLAEMNSSMEKRLAELESESKQLKDNLAQSTNKIEEGDNTRRSLEEQLAEKENQLAMMKEVKRENQQLKDDLAKATQRIEEGDKKRISLEQQLAEKDMQLTEKDKQLAEKDDDIVQKELHITQAVSHTPIKTDLPSNKDNIGTQLSPDTPRFNQFVEEHFTKPTEGEQYHVAETSPEKKIPYPSSVYTSPGNNETPKKYK